MRLEGQVALVTGAARGQGRSHAVRLAREGADVIAVDLCAPIASVPYPLATEADLDETCRLVEAADRRVVRAVADVRDLAAMTAAVDAGVAALGRLDIVVANAGVTSYVPSPEMTDEQWTDVLDVNLSGVWRTYRASIGHLRAGGRGGAIVITSSAAGLRALPNAAHYAAAKSGLVGFMKALAVELGPEGIRVNTIHPTTVDTGMVRNDATLSLFLPREDVPRTEEAFARVAQSLNVLPVPWISADVVSDLVVFLASESGRYITGAAIPVDAGMSVRW